ncbi:MAG: RnfABCDGE type electron transport complex subunit B [Butyrivibrio sp.]|nr:RnfABCDGE type electron transport complex subunit B [Butyrivibrio sp.]
MIIGIVIATAVVAGVGIAIGIILGLADMKLHVDVDEKEAAILELLPGNNCGGCGYPGCSGCAAAIAKGEAAVSQCPVGGAPVATAISAIMGVEAQDMGRQVAFVHCNGDCDSASRKYDYVGVTDCRLQAQAPGGGAKTCSYGCLGGGSCVSVCQFDAIHVVNGVAVVDKEACKACGKCVDICPNHLIDLIPYDAYAAVACKSHDMGKDVNQYCKVGCIACHICEKNCPAGAITVDNNVASINQETCANCGVCVAKCPKKAIVEH